MRFTGTGVASTDELALIEGIRANPDEDTPRLIYADWLEDNVTDDRSRATAEFIRLSCLMQKAKARIVPWEAREWLGKAEKNERGGLSFNFARLIPTLGLHIDVMNKRAQQPNPQDLTGEPLGYPKTEWEMDNRWLRLRYFAAPNHIPELIDIEFVRGFANRVMIRFRHQIDNVMPLLAWDQPFLRAQIHIVEYGGAYRPSLNEAPLYSYTVSKAVVEKIITGLPAGLSPDAFANFEAYTRFRWTGPDRKARRSDAISEAIRLATLDVLTGARQPDISVSWPKYTLPVL